MARTLPFIRLVALAAAVAGSAQSVAAASCRDYATCRQAVVAWCAGSHPGADRDRDGIPCENVCRTRADVLAIMAEIGCSR